jgi:glycosyltransferase involved in cell wall biosynthesis
MFGTRGAPKVSVCVVTYNQEPYIRACLQSLVDQRTDFEFEVIVGDDCSTDGTAAIIKEFAERYPDIIQPLMHSPNIGAAKNYFSVHELARGEYIAHVDGDDFALPGKLQIQADYLDARPACNIVWHRMYVQNESTGVRAPDLIALDRLASNEFRRADILRLITIGMNSSKMYRAAVRDFTFPDFAVVDYFANVEKVGDGFASFASDQPLGVYRTGIGIATAGNGTRILLQKSFLYFAKKYPRYRGDIGCAALVLFVAAAKNRNWDVALRFARVLAVTLRVGTLVAAWKNREIISMLRIPPSVR